MSWLPSGEHAEVAGVPRARPIRGDHRRHIALIDSLVGPRRSAPRMRRFIEDGERLVVPALVLYEWWRGPRSAEELAVQEALLPSEDAPAFGSELAGLAARLYRDVRRPRGREVDLAIAAHAIGRRAALWTLSIGDFADIPGLTVVPNVEARR